MNKAMEKLSIEEIHKTLKSFIDITLCAVCLETVRLDMVQCVNGHLFCTECRANLINLNICPTCRGEFSVAKPSRFISQVVEALPFRCKHRGCGKYLKTGDDHETFCGFKQTSCKLGQCEWKGPGQGILEHIKDQHPTEDVFTDFNNEIIYNFDPNENKSHLSAYSVQGQFFWHKIVNDVENKIFTQSFHFIPNGKPKNDYFINISRNYNELKCMFKMNLNLDTNDSAKDVNLVPIPQSVFYNPLGLILCIFLLLVMFFNFISCNDVQHLMMLISYLY